MVTQLGLCEVSGGYDMAGTFDDCACDCEQLLLQMTMIEWCFFFFGSEDLQTMGLRFETLVGFYYKIVTSTILHLKFF